MADKFSLIGRKGDIRFPEMQANVRYVSEKSLHWDTEDANGNAANGDEDIDYKRLSPNLHFLNWVEKDGWTVSQIIDTEKGEVTAYWSFHDDKSERGKRSSSFVNGQFKYAD
jgi:hypothetical protein